MSPLRSSVYCICMVGLLLCATGCVGAQASRTMEWENPTILSSSGDGEERYIPQVAMSGHGDTIVVWYESAGPTMVINARVYADGEWGSVVRLSTGIFNSFMPHVTMDDDGDAIVAWHQFDDVKNVINTRAFNNGTWGDVETISIGPGSSGEPKVSMNDHGDAAAVWQVSNGPSSAVNAATRTNGAWGEVAILSTGTGNAYGPQVAMSGSGDALATWYEYDGPWGAAYISAFSDGSWRPAIKLSTATDRHNNYPQVAMGDRGEAIVAWRVSDDAHSSINVRVGSSGSWGPETTLSTSTTRAENPQVAMNGDGAAVVVWDEYDGSKEVIRSTIFLNGVWEDASTISEGTGSSYSPQVAMNDRGDIVAAWYEQSVSGNVMNARACSDGVWESVERVSEFSGGHEVAIDQDGDAAAVWYQPDGDGQSIGMSNLWVLPTVTIEPGGGDIAINSTVIATFSEPMDSDTVEIGISDVPGTISWDGNVVTFSPSFGLDYDTTYAVHVSGEDVDGNAVSVTSTFSTLKDECTIVGTVAGIGGQAVADATVTMSNGMTTATDQGGRFQFSKVTSGPYEITIAKDGYEPLTITVNAVAGQSIEVGVLTMSKSPSGNEGSVWTIAILAAAMLAVGSFLVIRRRKG